MFWKIYIFSCVAVLTNYNKFASSQNLTTPAQILAPSKYLPELRIWSAQFNLVIDPTTTRLALGGECPLSENMNDFCSRILAETPRTASPFAIGLCAAQSSDYKTAIIALRQAFNDPREIIRFAAIEEFVDVLIKEKWSLKEIQSILDVQLADQLAAAFFRKQKFIEADRIYGWLSTQTTSTPRCNFIAAKSLVLTAMNLFDQATEVAGSISTSDATCRSLAFAARCQVALEKKAATTMVPLPYTCTQYKNQAALYAVSFARNFATSTVDDNWAAAQQYLLPLAGNPDVDDALLYLARTGACSMNAQKQIRFALKKLPKSADRLHLQLTTHLRQCPKRKSIR